VFVFCRISLVIPCFDVKGFLSTIYYTLFNKISNFYLKKEKRKEKKGENQIAVSPLFKNRMESFGI